MGVGWRRTGQGVPVEGLQEVLEQARDEVMGIYLWGSHATGEATPRSDIDLCVVAGPGKSKSAALGAVWRVLDRDCDVHAFEELPYHMRGAVLEHGRLLVAKDPAALHEYLRTSWKIWRVVKARIEAA